MRSLIALGCLTLSCGTGRERPPPAAHVPPPAAARPAAQPETKPAPLPPSLELGSEAACSYRDRIVHTHGGPLRLCLADGACYLEATAAPLQLPSVVTVGSGRDPHASIEIEHRGFVLRGLLRASAIALFVRRPTVMADWVIPNVVQVVEAKPGTLVAGVDLGSAASAEVAPTKTFACDDLALRADWFPYEDRLAAAGIQTSPTPFFLDVDELPLSTTPGGVTIARLTQRDAPVDAFAVRNRSTRIVFFTDDSALLFGWVPTRMLRRAPKPQGFAGASSSPKYWVASEERDLGWRCERDVPLFVELGGRHARVGQVKSGTTFRVLDRFDRDHATVAVPATLLTNEQEVQRREDLKLLGGASLLVLRRDVASCANR